MQKVVVGLSGGVDSAVAAGLLREQGWDVQGVTLKLLEYSSDEAPGCCTATDIFDANKTCSTLNVEHLVISRKKAFSSMVIQPYLEGLSSGINVNPCVSCNNTVKLPTLLEVASHLGIAHVATGHYARKHNGLLMRATDRSKDQTYFLWELTPDLIERLLFPLGELTKTKVRELASKFGLSVANKQDSVDLCFLEGGTKADFAEKHGVGVVPGEIRDTDGNLLGTHEGISKFTPGQRVRIPGSSTQRYVLKVVGNDILAGTKEETRTNKISLRNVVWHIDPDFSAPIELMCRYGQRDIPTVERIEPAEDGTTTVYLNSPVSGIAPGQSGVFYQNDCVIGGGFFVREP